MSQLCCRVDKHLQAMYACLSAANWDADKFLRAAQKFLLLMRTAHLGKFLWGRYFVSSEAQSVDYFNHSGDPLIPSFR